MEATPLAGSRVVVTGGSSGMGLAVAKQSVEAGAEVVLLARRRSLLDEAAAELGAKATVHELDVTNETAVYRVFDEIGDFDHLVTAAAVNTLGTVADLDLEAAKDFYASKFWGQYLCAREAASRLRPGGSITLFSGAGSRRVFPGFVLVGTAEAAIETLAKYLAQELQPLRVNAVVPGVIDTPLTAALPDWDKMRTATAQALPVKRVGRPEDVASAVLMLMTNGFMTGSVVDVDGGHSAL